MSAVVAPKQVNPVLAAYLAQLVARPLLTKCITSGTLSFLQEIVAGKIAGVSPPEVKSCGFPLIDLAEKHHKAIKLGAYGFFVSAPLSHYLVGLLQRQFAGRVDGKAKLLQILANNFLVSPIIISAYLASMAVINGARSVQSVLQFVKLGFTRAYRISLFTNPMALLAAQRFVAPELWVPFFALISFLLGTKLNVDIKRSALLAKAKAEAAKKEAERK